MGRYWWLVIVGLGVFFYLVRSVLTPFVVAVFLAYMLDPLVEAAGRRLKLGRPLVVGGLYAVFLGITGATAAFLVPTLLSEARDLARHGPEILEGVFTQLFGSPVVDLFGQPVTARALGLYLVGAARELFSQPREAFQVAAAVVEGLFSIFVTLVATFYLLLDGRRLAVGAVRLLPAAMRSEVMALAGPVHRVLRRYLWGQLFLVGFMAAVTYAVLSLGFRLRYALVLGLVTGVLEVIPFLGPVAAAAVAAGVGLVQLGPGGAAGIIVAYFVLRQLEDQIVMPVVLGRAVGLHPVVTLFAVLSGGALAGAVGLVLAVPVAATLKIIVDHFASGPDNP
jgi:predicted PurR-regulated permease PerM